MFPSIVSTSLVESPFQTARVTSFSRPGRRTPSIRNMRPGVPGGSRLPATHWTWLIVGSSSSRAMARTARGLAPRRRAEDRGEDAALAFFLGQVADAEHHRLVVVGELVEGRDRVADVGLVVRCSCRRCGCRAGR